MLSAGEGSMEELKNGDYSVFYAFSWYFILHSPFLPWRRLRDVLFTAFTHTFYDSHYNKQQEF